MTFRSKLISVCLVLMSITLVGGGFAYWAAGELAYHSERSRLAHRVLEGHLELKVQIYQLFKQRMDGLLSDAADNPDAERQALAALMERLKSLRQIIASEIALVRGKAGLASEAEELESLAAVERQVIAIVDAFGQVRRLNGEGQPEAARRLLDRTLEQSIDEQFSRLLRQTIEAEAAQVEAVDSAAARTVAEIRRLAVGFTLLGVLVTAAALFILLTRFARPARALAEGAARLAAGDLGSRVHIDGDDEFARLAGAVNAMAEQLQRDNGTRRAGHETLERLVAQRTAALKDAVAALQSSDASRRRLFADISHELRTPLTVIKGEAEIILRGAVKPPDDYMAVLRRIIQQVDHTRAMVDDLLFMARSEAGQTRMAMQAVALCELVERVCADAEALAAEKANTIRLTALVADVVVTGDPLRLRQAMMILLDNALRYSPPHAPVTVTLAAAPGGVAVQVADQGVGIAADEIDRVFDRFYRGAGADRQNAGGSGLGLPIARAIVEAHKGSIQLVSAPGEGTRVSVFLPVSRRLRIVA